MRHSRTRAKLAREKYDAGDAIASGEPIQHRGGPPVEEYAERIRTLHGAKTRLEGENSAIEGEVLALRRELGHAQGEIAELEGKCIAFHAASQRGDMRSLQQPQVVAEDGALNVLTTDEARDSADAILLERVSNLSQHIDEVTFALKHKGEELADQRKLCKALEKENATLRNDNIATKAHNEEELTRLMFDLKEIQNEMGQQGSQEGLLAQVQGENLALRGELAKERGEGRLLFQEVERLQTTAAHTERVHERNGRLEAELKTRPVLTSPPPQQHMAVSQLATPLPPYTAQTHTTVHSISSSRVQRARSPPLGLAGDAAAGDSPLLSPRVSRLARLASPVAKKGPQTARGAVSSPPASSYKSRALSEIDACLGHADALEENPFVEAMHSRSVRTESVQPRPDGQRPTLLRNPLDNWG